MIRVGVHIVAAAVLGAALALTAFSLFVAPLAWLSLIVWAVVAGVVGFVVRSWRLTILDCAVVGFVIVLTYSILGYQGAASLATALPVFALIAVVGAVGTTAAGCIGHLVRTRARRTPSKS